MTFQAAFLALVLAAFGSLAITLFTVSIWSRSGKAVQPTKVTPAKRPEPEAAYEFDLAA